MNFIFLALNFLLAVYFWNEAEEAFALEYTMFGWIFMFLSACSGAALLAAIL